MLIKPFFEGCNLWWFCVTFYSMVFLLFCPPLYTHHIIECAHNSFIYNVVIHLDTNEYVQQEKKEGEKVSWMFPMCSRLSVNPGKTHSYEKTEYICIEKNRNGSLSKWEYGTAKREKKKHWFQVVLVILWSLVKRLDSHAAVISQGQSHTPLSLPPPSCVSTVVL